MGSALGGGSVPSGQRGSSFTKRGLLAIGGCSRAGQRPTRWTSRLRGLLLLEELGVLRDLMLLLARHFVRGKDGVHRADGLAGAAVDADVGIDEVLLLGIGGLDAIDGTLLHAGLILDVDAGVGDDVGHSASNRFFSMPARRAGSFRGKATTRRRSLGSPSPAALRSAGRIRRAAPAAQARASSPRGGQQSPAGILLPCGQA